MSRKRPPPPDDRGDRPRPPRPPRRPGRGRARRGRPLPPRDPVKFPFGESLPDDSMADLGPDPVKFPFGETGERPGARRPFGESRSEIAALDDSDLDAFDVESSLDLESDPFGSSGSAERLPGLPPDSRLDDDASIDGLEDALADASSSAVRDPSEESGPGLSPSELGELPSEIGNIGSGPLVIVEEDDAASTRYQASVVDDSIRVAGSKSVRGPAKRRKPSGKRRKPPPADLEQSSEWAEEPLEDDVSVPTPSGRRSGRGSRRSARLAPPPRPSRKGVVLMALLGLAATVGVGLFQEQRRRADLDALKQQSGAELEAAHSERRQAIEDLQAKQSEALEAEQAQRRAAADAHAREVERLEGQLAQARKQADDSAQALEQLEEKRRKSEAALEAELASARQAAADQGPDEELQTELQQEQTRRQQAEQALEEERARAKQEEGRLKGELAAARTRVKTLEQQLEEARKNAAAATQVKHGSGEGGGADEGGGDDDWDQYFDDESKNDTGEGQGGGFDDFFDDQGQEEQEEAGGGWLEETNSFFAKVRDVSPLHGYLGYKNFTHFSTGPPGHDLHKIRDEFRMNVGYRDWLWRSSDLVSGVRLVAALDVRFTDDHYTSKLLPTGIDDEEDKRPVIAPDEIYLGLSHDFFTFRAGYQKFSWGTGDLFNPVNRINPIDYSDLFDPRKIPVLAYTAALDFEEVSLQLVAVPTFTRSRLPLKGQRFDVLAAANVPVIAADDPDTTIQNAQWAGRLTVRKFGWDVSATAYTGFDPVPAGQVALQSVFPLVGQVVTEFNKIHVLGLDFATTLGFLGLEGKLGELLSGVQLHGEGAHVWYEGERSDDVIQYVFGFNYQFVDLIFEHDLTVIVEYAGELETHKAEQALPGTTLSRVFRSAWLGRLVYQVNEDLNFALNGALLVHGPDSIYLHPEATWDATPWLQVRVGGDFFAGSRGTFFGQFKQDDRFVGELRILF